MAEKKGIMSFYVLMFTFFRMFVLLGIIVAIILIIRMFIASTVDVSQAESEILTNNLIYAVSYEDPVTHRIYPLQISAAQLGKKDLDKIFGMDKRGIAAKVSILDDSGKLLSIDGAEIQPRYLNKKGYTRWIELAMAKAKGVGGARAYSKSVDVLIIETGRRAMMEISVTVPNS
jgi:hypothetical protein